jgi:hypothetical protein
VDRKSEQKNTKTMKNIDLYNRISIFLELYYQRTKLNDLGGFLGVASMLVYKDNPHNPIGLQRRMVDICIWQDWLNVIGLKHLGMEPLTVDFEQYIEDTGKTEIEDSNQLDFMLDFLKFIEQDWEYDWSQLFYDLEEDFQTKEEWEESCLLLQQYLLLDKNNECK